MATTMKTPAENIQKLEEDIEELKVERRAAKEQLMELNGTNGNDERTHINKRIDILDKRIIVLDIRLNLFLEAQKEGKFFLSFSLFPFFLNNILNKISQTCYNFYCFAYCLFGSIWIFFGNYR